MDVVAVGSEAFPLRENLGAHRVFRILWLGKVRATLGPHEGRAMGLIVFSVIVAFALACWAVCWEESRNLPKTKKRVTKAARARIA